MRKMIVLLIASAALCTSACNTIAGVGKDTQEAGSAITNCAEGRC